MSSPPYEGLGVSSGEGPNASGERHGNYATTETANKAVGVGYIHSDGNLGDTIGTTFWEASKEIVAQCYAILRPGAYTAWVVKGYVKNKALVDFPAQWRQLCEACGFEYVEEAHASLVKVEHVGNDLFSGEAIIERKSRKSFFVV